MELEYDDSIGDYHKTEKGGSFVKIKNEDVTDVNETSKINRLPSHSGLFSSAKQKNKESINKNFKKDSN